MAVEDSVAQDQLRAFVERIERMEEEKAAISSDIKEIYAEAKGNGFDTKILRRIVTIRKQDANERMEQEALLELYMSALNMVPAPPEYIEERDRFNALASKIEADLRGPKADPLAALKADPSLAIVDVANLKNKSENQPSPKAGSDLTVSPSPQGQVAPYPVANVEEETNGAEAVASNDTASREVDDADRQQVAASGISGEGQAAPADLPTNPAEPDATPTGAVVANRSGVTGGESAATIYPIPGQVYWENTPRRPVHRHEYSAAFSDLGQDHYVIKEDISCARSAPIVMIGDTILDGWARYNCARCMVGLDGQTAQYPAVQYDGTDPLIDCIKLNVDGRILDEKQKRLIADRLTRLEPSRKDDIYKAFELWMEPV